VAMVLTRAESFLIDFIQGFAGGHATDAKFSRKLIFRRQPIGKTVRYNALQKMFFDLDILGDFFCRHARAISEIPRRVYNGKCDKKNAPIPHLFYHAFFA
jgi:hypothetical protein